jgi:hypothetical protein
MSLLSGRASFIKNKQEAQQSNENRTGQLRGNLWIEKNWTAKRQLMDREGRVHEDLEHSPTQGRIMSPPRILDPKLATSKVQGKVSLHTSYFSDCLNT